MALALEAKGLYIKQTRSVCATVIGCVCYYNVCATLVLALVYCNFLREVRLGGLDTASNLASMLGYLGNLHIL